MVLLNYGDFKNYHNLIITFLSPLICVLKISSSLNNDKYNYSFHKFSLINTIFKLLLCFIEENRIQVLNFTKLSKSKNR